MSAGRMKLGASKADFTQGFLTASLVYCVGAMAVVGSLNSGLTGDHQVLYAKSMLDGTTAILFTASLAWEWPSQQCRSSCIRGQLHCWRDSWPTPQ